MEKVYNRYASKCINYNEKRDINIDICRGIGILLVILGHQFQNWDLTYLMQFIYSFHMPLLFIISGIFLKKEGKFSDFAKNKAKRLLIPYIFCVSVMTVLEPVRELLRGGNWLKCFLKDLYISLYGSGSGYGSFITFRDFRIGTSDDIGMLWFLPALFSACMIVRLCLTMKIKKCTILILLISLIGCFSSHFVWLPFSIQNGMACSGWVYLGYLVGHYHILDNISKFYRRWYFFAVGMIVWFISIVWGCTKLYENYYRLGIVEVAGAIFASGVIYLLAEKIKNKTLYLSALLCWVGKNTMAFYALHFLENRLFPISNLLKKLNFLSNIVISAVLCWIVVAILCVVGTTVMGKIPLLKKIFCIQMSEK